MLSAISSSTLALGLVVGLGLDFLVRRAEGGGRACLRVDYVVTTRACFGTGVVPWLVAENTLEHAVAFARDTVLAWAFVVMLLHRMIAGTLRTADLSFRNRAFLSARSVP